MESRKGRRRWFASFCSCSLFLGSLVGHWMGLAEPKGGPIRSKDFTPGQGFDSIVVEMASFAVFYLQWLKASHPRAATEVIGAPQHPSLGRFFRCFQCVDCFAQCSFLETYHNLPHLNSIDTFRFVFLDVSGIVYPLCLVRRFPQLDQQLPQIERCSFDRSRRRRVNCRND